MFPKVMKFGKVIDMQNILKTYIIQNYGKYYDAFTIYSIGQNSLDQSLQNYFGEIQQNRNSVIMLNLASLTVEEIKERKEILAQYINNLRLLMSKISFNSGNQSVQMDFQWTDTLKGSTINSKHCSFEYFSNLFNYAVINFTIGELLVKEGDNDDKLKEAIKNFQYAAGLFENIKNEGTCSIPQKDLPNDMTAYFLTFCSFLCQAFGQIYLLKVANKKKTNFDLQAQIAKGIEEIFNNAYMLANDTLKKQCDDSLKYYLLNRKNYYEAVSYEKMRDKIIEQFNKNGENYGKAISYQNGLIAALTKNEKDHKKLKGYEPKGDDLNLTMESNRVKEMNEKNRIYFSPIADVNTLPQPEKKIMANPAMPPELQTNIASRKELDALIPNEVREMSGQYKNQMNNYLASALNNFDNESTIQGFLNQLDLPANLETMLSQSEISDSLWKKISDIQSKGGAMYLANTIQVIESEPDGIETRINDTLMLIQNEEIEDTKLRQQYQNRWARKPSNTLNMAYIATLNDKKLKLSQGKQFGATIKGEIMNGMENYDLLKLSREQLNEKIPKKVDKNQMASCNEANELRKDIDRLENHKEKCMEIIGKLFTTLTDENVNAQFMQVLQNKANPNDIFETNKEKYNMMLNELQGVDNEIKMLKMSIDNKNKAFLQVKESMGKQSPENEEFFKKLDYCTQQYHEKEIQVQQGLNFYKMFNNELNEYNRIVTDFLSARDMNKQTLIREIMQGGSGSSSSSGSGVNPMGQAPIQQPNEQKQNMDIIDIRPQQQQQPQQLQQVYGQQQQQQLYGQQQVNPMGPAPIQQPNEPKKNTDIIDMRPQPQSQQPQQVYGQQQPQQVYGQQQQGYGQQSNYGYQQQSYGQQSQQVPQYNPQSLFGQQPSQMSQQTSYNQTQQNQYNVQPNTYNQPSYRQQQQPNQYNQPNQFNQPYQLNQAQQQGFNQSPNFNPFGQGIGQMAFGQFGNSNQQSGGFGQQPNYNYQQQSYSQSPSQQQQQQQQQGYGQQPQYYQQNYYNK